MHIAIDTAPLGDKPRAGTATYTMNLIKSLASLDQRNTYTIYGMRFDFAELSIISDNFRFKQMPDFFGFMRYGVSLLTWYYTGFPFQLSADKPDIFLSTYYNLPLYCPCPAVIVVYDLTPFILKGSHLARFKFLFKKQILYAIQGANRIIAISNSTKNDLIRLLKADTDKISVIYPGYDDTIFKPANHPDQVSQVRLKYNIDTDYILYVGTLEPRKNIGRLIEALARLEKAKNIHHKLVIAGGKGWLYEDIFKTVDKLDLHSKVVFTDYVAQEDLPLLLNGATAFVYPSFYEGFGIPPLEAMACGTPVITSNSSSLPEVVGDAGILVDPYNVNEIAEAIYRVVSDSGLRGRMRRKGLDRAKLFSWERAAQETLQILEETYSSRHVHR